MPFQCEKRSLTLVWSILECIFFSGILNGWIWLQQIFKEDNYFIGNCNVTGVASRTEDVVPLTVPESKPPIITLNNERWICVYEKVRIIQPEGHILTSILPSTVGTPTPQEVETITAVTVEDIVSQNSTEVLCWEQDDNLELFISLAFIIRNILMLPLGIFLDRYGTGRTRILAISFLACGSLLMLFSNKNFPWLGIPALTLLAMSGLLVLLTDIQIANLFGTRRYTIMSLFVGSYYSGGLVLFFMKMSKQRGVSLQTSFMFMAVGIVPILVSTIALLPKSRIPWPLPADYGQGRHSGYSKDDTSRDWHRLGMKKQCDDSMRMIVSVWKNSIFLWLLLWFSVLSLKTFVFDMNIDLILWNITEDINEVNYYMDIYGMILLFSLPASPIIGVVMDWKRQFVIDPKTDQMMNILNVFVITFILSFTSGITGLLPHTSLQLVSFVLVMLEKVAALASLCAILTHVHFPSESFGRCMGLVLCVSGIAMVLQFPFKKVVHSSFHNQVFYINIILLVLLLFAAGHPINVWYHCKLDRIQDTSVTGDKKSVTIQLMKRQDPEAVIERAPLDSKGNISLHVTDL